jgi:TPR repeat protein
MKLALISALLGISVTAVLLATAYSQPISVQPMHAPPDPCEEKTGIVVGPSCGWAFEHGDGRPQDYNKALQLYRESAEKGNPVGQDLLGRLYRDGRGVPQNCVEAEKWFRKAADQLSNDGKADLGNLYAEGCKAVAPNYEESYFWLSLPHWPHDGDYPRLSDGHIINMAYDFDSPCIDAALQKDKTHLTQQELGTVLARVGQWRPPYSPADDLGTCFENGNGVVRSGRAQITWCFNAAKGGYGPAMENLGSFYNSGNVSGIKQDYTEAYFWWSLAIRNMSPEKAQILASVRDLTAKKLTPEQKASADKRVQEWKPLAKNEPK